MADSGSYGNIHLAAIFHSLLAPSCFSALFMSVGQGIDGDSGVGAVMENSMWDGREDEGMNLTWSLRWLDGQNVLIWWPRSGWDLMSLEGQSVREGRETKTDNTAHRWRPCIGYRAIKTSPGSHWAITVKGRNRGADFYHKSRVGVLIFCTVMRNPFQQDRWYPESLQKWKGMEMSHESTRYSNVRYHAWHGLHTSQIRELHQKLKPVQQITVGERRSNSNRLLQDKTRPNVTLCTEHVMKCRAWDDNHIMISVIS